MADSNISDAERRRIINEKRLAVKAAHREREAATRLSSSSSTNAHNKRPLEVTPATSTSPTAVRTRSYPVASTSSSLRNATTSVGALQGLTMGDASGGEKGKGKEAVGRDGFPVVDDPNKPLPNRLGKYLEYDLSTLKNSKGGFLLDSELDSPRERRQREQEALNKQKRIEAMHKQGLLSEHFLSLDERENPKCKICASQDIDHTFHKVFYVNVCAKCKHENPERFSLLTKTEAKEDYLLTDPELKDADILPHLLKANPHRSTYSNMMLFLREQVESYAFSEAKWGSPEALDAEFEKREEERKKKKNKKFEQSLKELRRRTVTNKWHERKDAEHKHEFGDGSYENENGQTVQRCSECGLEIEIETF